MADGEQIDEEPLAVVIAAREEADLIEGTVAAARRAFPGATVWVADDASRDATATLAALAGARVISRAAPLGKGANVTAAVRAALADRPRPAVVLLCDGDLGASAARLGPLVAAVEAGECDVAVAAFARRVGGGLGIAVGFARWAVRRLCGLRTRAPISGQRALRVATLEAALPFADGFGMEIGMTIDAVRAGYRVGEYELDLSHRATFRDAAGFRHRARQLRDIAAAAIARFAG